MSSLVPILPSQRGSRELDVVFIHGLGGHFNETWSTNGELWPEWIAVDNPNYFVWSYSYPASPTDWKGHTTPLLDRAYSLHSDMIAEGCGTVPIVFVAHSLGGLVVKQMLRNVLDLHASPEWPDEIGTNTAGVVFFGTPHQGADHAKLVSALSLLTRASVTIEELENNDHRLTELNTWFVNKFATLKCEALVFQETKPVTVLGKSIGIIVDSISSNPGIPQLAPVPMDEDHISICKFADRDVAPYKRVVQLLKRAAMRRSAVPVGRNGGLAIEVSVANEYPPLDFTGQISADTRRTAKYKWTRSKESLQVHSFMEYVQDFRDGRELQPISYVWCPFRWLFPTLDFKIVNNSNETIVLTELAMFVRSSRPHHEVLLLIRDVRYVFGSLEICNEGSMPARGASVAFNVFPAGEAGSSAGPYEFCVSVGDIITSAGPIVLTEEDVDLLAARDSRIADGIEQYQVVEIAGELSWTEDGSSRRQIRFRSPIFCGPAAPGLFGPPTGRYSVMLKAWGDEYYENVSLSQNIAPGEADRFQVVVGAPCWSDHHIELSIRGLPRVSVELSNLDLEIFIPRSQSNS
ncbi:MAG: alpha/beta hydrolase, partial [Planctomycetaceae bacterium]|nr:alpha/beta hydrolase [Planctomycetaceae bacterium]